MDDKNGALEKLKAAMDEAERVDMSSVKIGDPQIRNRPHKMTQRSKR